MTASLVLPYASCRGSFITALREFQAENMHPELDADDLDAADAFASYVDALHAAALPETPRPPDYVPATTYWYVEGDEYLGTLQIRHELTPLLRTVGGHIGYEVRPAARRRGHATRMLALSLPCAHALGIDPALVTCDRTNEASRKVIEANGGRPDTPLGIKLRYWIPTA